MKRLFICASVLLGFIWLGTFGLSQNKLDVPFVPTPDEVVDEMLRMADMNSKDVLYDLGCGDGRIVIAAATRYGVRAVGVDIDSQRIHECKANALLAKVEDKVEFLLQDLFLSDIHEATVVTLYLLPSVNFKLRPKLLTELRPGTRVVSHNYDMGGWEPDKMTEMMVRERSHKIFLWIIPTDVGGTWELATEEEKEGKRYRLSIDQKFQVVTGIATSGSSILPLKNPLLTGDRIQFSIEDKDRGRDVLRRFEGRVKEGLMVGEVESSYGSEPKKSRWTAKKKEDVPSGATSSLPF